MRKQMRWLAVIGVLTLVAAACGSDDGDGGGSSGGGRPCSGKVYDTIGKGEGALKLIAWNGYTEGGATDRATTG